ncbi:MAG: phosphotransferase [Albidovulum sp.]
MTTDLRPLPGGHRNAAFRTVGLSQELVFKSTRRAPAAVHWLLQVQDLARRSGFVVPRFIMSRRNRIVENGWTCETFIEGTALMPGEMPTILPQIEAFHDSAASLVQRPGFLSSKTFLDQAAGGDVDLNVMPPDLVFLCRNAWRAVSDRGETVIHGDLNAGNLLICPDGNVALLDWDECRRDLALFDLGQVRVGDDEERRASLAWEAACSWRTEPEYARAVASRL